MILLQVAFAVALGTAVLLYQWYSRSVADIIDSDWEPAHVNAPWDSARCTIQRVHESDLSVTQFYTEFWGQRPVVIIRDPTKNSQLRAKCTKALLRQRGNASVEITSLGSYAFQHAQMTTLRDFIHHLPTASADTLAKDAHFSFKSALGLEEDYHHVVAISTGQGKHFQAYSFQLAVGGNGTGLAFHSHFDATSESLHGKKRWFLAPPYAPPVFNPRHTSAHWLQHVYPTLDASSKSQLDECVVKPGELLYIPRWWFHSTLAIGAGVSMSVFYHIDAERRPSELSQDELGHLNAPKGKMLRSFIAWGKYGLDATLNGRQNASLFAFGQCLALNPLFAPCHAQLAGVQEQMGLLEDSRQHTVASKQLHALDEDDLPHTINRCC